MALETFSTNNLKIYSEGGEKTRIEKFETIKDYKIAQKHLHVCTSKSTNCGKCSKCKRTLLILYALNKIDDFKEVFDIKYFKENKNMYLEWLYNEHLNNNIMNEPTFQTLKNDEYIQKLINKNKNFAKITMKIKTKTNTLKEIYKTKGLKETIKEIKHYIKR